MAFCCLLLGARGPTNTLANRSSQARPPFITTLMKTLQPPRSGTGSRTHAQEIPTFPTFEEWASYRLLCRYAPTRTPLTSLAIAAYGFPYGSRAPSQLKRSRVLEFRAVGNGRSEGKLLEAPYFLLTLQDLASALAPRCRTAGLWGLITGPPESNRRLRHAHWHGRPPAATGISSTPGGESEQVLSSFFMHLNY
jgi:hypothetical protein